jgi:hypothetical protein
MPVTAKRMRASAVAALAVLSGAAVAAGVGGQGTAAAAGRHVLLVGTYHGIKGQYSTIQKAVDAASPYDVVLVGPGDYHERGDYTTHPPRNGRGSAGVWITTPHLTVRGMNRNSVVVDGTKPGSSTCSKAASAQDYGPLDSANKHIGRNGVEVWKATDVTIENMTVCNFLDGTGNDGNEIWWNGGDDSGTVGGFGAFYGAYLTATATYFPGENNAAQYGIFSSNWTGGTAKAEWDYTYTSNFNDSGYYIGACRQICNQVVNHAWAEYSALGYSGSNSGGTLIVENSEFDKNQDGFDTNSQNGDNPPPQNGSCPSGVSPITHTTSCWVFMHNYVHDNNNPNVPSAGLAAEGPIGTGMSISGGRFDTVMDNTFANNGAWGVILVPFPDGGPPCTGGVLDPVTSLCLYDDWGNVLKNNTFTNNGSFGNPTNGDIAVLQSFPDSVNNCLTGNTDTGGTLTVSPPTATTAPTNCQTSVPNGGTTANAAFLAEVACDSGADINGVSGSAACLPTDSYPRHTTTIMHPLPAGLVTMPNPCAGVPANPWCPAKSTSSGGSAAGRGGSLALTGMSPLPAFAGLAILAVAGVGWRLRRR